MVLADISARRPRRSQALGLAILSVAALGIALAEADFKSALPRQALPSVPLPAEPVTFDASSAFLAEDDRDLDRYVWRVADADLGGSSNFGAMLAVDDPTAVSDEAPTGGLGGTQASARGALRSHVRASKDASAASAPALFARGENSRGLPWAGQPPSEPFAQTPKGTAHTHLAPDGSQDATAATSAPAVIAEGPTGLGSPPQGRPSKTSTPETRPSWSEPPVTDALATSPTPAPTGYPGEGRVPVPHELPLLLAAKESPSTVPSATTPHGGADEPSGLPAPPNKLPPGVGENVRNNAPPATTPHGGSDKPSGLPAPSTKLPPGVGDNVPGNEPPAITPPGGPAKPSAPFGSPIDAFLPDDILGPVTAMLIPKPSPASDSGTDAPTEAVAQATSVPEPASVLLVAVGLIMLGALSTASRSPRRARGYEARD
jgi:hypothetical protein